MALNLKSERVERLARDLARRRGQTIMEVVLAALEEQARKEDKKTKAPGMAEELLEIGRRFSELPSFDDRSDDEILGYDENGLFR
jgi:antitoxin VapB